MINSPHVFARVSPVKALMQLLPRCIVKSGIRPENEHPDLIGIQDSQIPYPILFLWHLQKKKTLQLASHIYTNNIWTINSQTTINSSKPHLSTFSPTASQIPPNRTSTLRTPIQFTHPQNYNLWVPIHLLNLQSKTTLDHFHCWVRFHIKPYTELIICIYAY